MLMSRADQSFPAHLALSLVPAGSPLRRLPVSVAYDSRWLARPGGPLAPSAGNGVSGYQAVPEDGAPTPVLLDRCSGPGLPRPATSFGCPAPRGRYARSVLRGTRTD